MIKSHSFLHLLRTSIPFVWDQHVQDVFDALKKAMDSTMLLSAPNLTKDFILYVSASENAITSVLVQEDNDRQ